MPSYKVLGFHGIKRPIFIVLAQEPSANITSCPHQLCQRSPTYGSRKTICQPPISRLPISHSSEVSAVRRMVISPFRARSVHSAPACNLSGTAAGNVEWEAEIQGAVRPRAAIYAGISYSSSNSWAGGNVGWRPLYGTAVDQPGAESAPGAPSPSPAHPSSSSSSSR